MATLTTPNMDLVKVFDANYPFTFTFSYSGMQIVKNKLVIKNNDTLEIVYSADQVGMKLIHMLPANTLVNNAQYLAQIQVYDADGNSSNLSEPILFSCYSNPTFEFSNVYTGMKVTTGNLETQLTFIQLEGDELKECVFQLYDTNQIMLSASDYVYDTFKYTYYGLSNFNTYYLRAIGVSKYGFKLDTGFVEITTNFLTVEPNIVLTATNSNGRILISSNIITTDYDIDGKVEIVNEEAVVYPNSSLSYVVKDVNDFTLIIRGQDFNVGDVAILHTPTDAITLSVINTGDDFCAKLRVSNKDDETKYVLYEDILGQLLGADESGALSIHDGRLIYTIAGEKKDAIIYFTVCHKDGLYSLSAYYN